MQRLPILSVLSFLQEHHPDKIVVYDSHYTEFWLASGIEDVKAKVIIATVSGKSKRDLNPGKWERIGCPNGQGKDPSYIQFNANYAYILCDNAVTQTLLV